MIAQSIMQKNIKTAQEKLAMKNGKISLHFILPFSTSYFVSKRKKGNNSKNHKSTDLCNKRTLKLPTL